MALDYSTSSASGERLDLKPHAGPLSSAAWIVGIGGIVVAFVLALVLDQSVKRFFFAYLVSFAYFLSLALGGLFIVLLQHVTKAAWSVNLRRIPEWLAASMPILGLMAAPIGISVLLHRGDLYPWAEPKSHPAEVTPAANAQAGAVESAESKHATAAEPADEEMTGFKKVYLNPFFWLVRIAFYFVVWSGMGIWYWRQSLRQDETGDDSITSEMQRRSAPFMVVFAITLTGAAFDLLMSLDPSWSSTMFGVYFFAGSTVSTFAAIIVALYLLQRAGYLRDSISIEHYHDLGKFLFGFTFFWGYIAFGQYMLIWYANIPEETSWYLHRGATTSAGTITPWSYVIVALLFGQVLIPFAGLLSRHVKRVPSVLCFWAVWVLVFHWIDMFWVVMPEMEHGVLVFGPVEIAAFLGIGGVFLAFVLSRAVQGSLRPTHDPRLQASLEFQNV